MDDTNQNQVDQNIDLNQPVEAVQPETVIEQSSQAAGVVRQNKQWFLYGGLAVVVIFVVGISIYITKLKTTSIPANAVKSKPSIAVSPSQIPVPTLSSSDDVQTLENEIKTTDFTSLDQDLNQINQEAQGL